MIRDILSSHSPKALFASGAQLAASNTTAALDLSKGTTALFLIDTSFNTITTGQLDTIEIEYADDEAFTVNVESEPVDATTGLSTLGNKILNMNVGDFDLPQLYTSLPDTAEDWALPTDLSSYLMKAAIAVVNPLDTKRFCRVKFTVSSLTGTSTLYGIGFVGPVGYKAPDGGIA